MLDLADAARQPPRRPVAVDLFSGAGGLSLGFEQAGFDIVAAVEYDPVHAATHKFNFPHCEVLCVDVVNLSPADVLTAAQCGFRTLNPHHEWPGQVDAIIGGPPCQGFSAGGKRESGDERNDLLLQFVRLVEELRPRTICLENVAGLLESKFNGLREGGFRRLRRAGYELSGTDGSVNSRNFGIPQSRRRVIVLGALGERAPLHPQPLTTATSVRDALDGLPSPERYPALLTADEVVLSREDAERLASTTSVYARRLAGLDPTVNDKSWPRLWSRAHLTGSRRTIHTLSTLQRFSATERGALEPKSRLYRLSLDGPSRTLRAGTGPERGSHTSPRPIHPTEQRVITVREAARLHGYPDWFRFHTTNWHGHRQVGNSVPPPLARAAALVLIEVLQCTPLPPRVAVPLGDVSLLQLSQTRAMKVLNELPEEVPHAREHEPAVMLDKHLVGARPAL